MPEQKVDPESQEMSADQLKRQERLLRSRIKSFRAADRLERDELHDRTLQRKSLTSFDRL